VSDVSRRRTIPSELETRLSCPVCKRRLELTAEVIHCPNDACRASFPVLRNVPILINEANSLFQLSDFTDGSATFFRETHSFETRADRLLPDFYRAAPARRNFGRFTRELLTKSSTPIVLVIGGSILGSGIEPLLEACPPAKLVETDVALGPRTMLICDAHDLPFAAETFDGVVLQAVLQHVVDPVRCVEEAWRVLKTDGLIYVQTPFMQPVHAKLDFSRFTHLGLRWLFRRFEELDSGVMHGPGTALGLSFQYFLLSFAQRRSTRGFLRAAARTTSFFLKYCDIYLNKRPGSLDAAAGYYFLGAKSTAVLPEEDLLRQFRGGLT
jgi:SAM-dependent methyltransferase